MAVLAVLCMVALLGAFHLRRKYRVTLSDVRNASLLKSVLRRLFMGKTKRLDEHPLAQHLERRKGLPVVCTWQQLRSLGAAGVEGHMFVEGDALAGLLKRDAERNPQEDLVNMSAEEEAKLSELGVPARDLLVLRHTCPCGREMNAYDLLQSAAKTHGIPFLRMFLQRGSIVNMGARPKIPVTCTSCGGVRELSHRYTNKQYHCYKCFGAGNTVRLEDGRVLTMGELRVGDRVATPGGEFQPVFHLVTGEQPVPMLRIRFVLEDVEGAVELTDHHLLYVGDERMLVAASMVLVGDRVWLEPTRGSGARPGLVTAVKRVSSAPVSVFTPSGHVLASGVQSSCFTTNTIQLTHWLTLVAVLHFLRMPAWVPARITDVVYGVSKRVR